eukprot:ANDGO_06022.mRNA.1 hypothetical protein
MIRLSDYVHPEESIIFDAFLSDMANSCMVTGFAAGLVKAHVKVFHDLAVSMFGPQSSADIQGSAKKGTTVHSSDVDVYVSTPKPVTLQERERFVERLQEHPCFHPHHVKLGKLAIHIKAAVDYDVVFGNTVEYGERPLASTSLDKFPVAQSAVRVLKFVSRQFEHEKVPGMFLESLVERVFFFHQQRNEAPSTAQCMRIAVDILQVTVDENSEWMREKWWKTVRKQLQLYFRSILRLFVISRIVLGKGFRTPRDIQSWLLLQALDTFSSPAGPIPEWLLDAQHSLKHRQMYPYAFRSGLEGFGGQDAMKDGSSEASSSTQHSSQTKCIERYVGLLQIVAKPGHAWFKYVSVTPDDDKKEDELPRQLPQSFRPEVLRDLSVWAEQGSTVAGRMLRTRTTWIQGEMALFADNVSEATRLFAFSLRSSVSDGDPFSGCYTTSNGDISRYTNAASLVLLSDTRNVDAMLLLASIAFNTMRCKEAIEHCKRGIAVNPRDAYGCWHMMGSVCGNQGDFQACLDAYAKASQIAPEEPMFHYWCAVACSNIRVSDVEFQRTRLQQFLDLAAPEGRKYCEALYRLALLELSSKHSDVSTSFLRGEACFQRGLALERNMLKCFPPCDCEAKTRCEILTNISRARIPKKSQSAPGLDPALSFIEAMRPLAKLLFESGNLNNAIQVYSKMHAQNIEDPSTASMILANRSLAYIRLGMFTLASRDALAALRFDPTSIKGHYRLAQAEMGKQNTQKALVAVEKGIACGCGSALESFTALRLQILETCPKDSPIPTTPGVKMERIGGLFCWEDVLFKDNFVVVSPTANDIANFVSIVDAVSTVVADHPGCSGISVLLLEGVYEELLHFHGGLQNGDAHDAINPALMTIPLPSIVIGSVVVQLLGQSSTACYSQLAKNGLAKQHPVASIACSAAFMKRLGIGNAMILAVTGSSCKVVVQNIQLLITCGQGNGMPSNCVSVGDGATATFVGCRFFNPDAPCIATTGLGTTISLDNCKFKKFCSAGIVIEGGSHATATHCLFKNFRFAAVELRGAASEGTFTHCHFRDCGHQSAFIYQGARRLTMEDCEITRCGSNPRYSGVLLGCGATILRRCKIHKNEAEGVVVQADEVCAEGRPFLVMEDCQVFDNDAGVLFGAPGGYGVLRRCVIEYNSSSSVLINDIAADRKLNICNNRIRNYSSTLHSQSADIAVMGGQALRSRIEMSENDPR